MKHLKLEVSDLRVESFDTSAGDGRRGTVFGEEGSSGEYAPCTCPQCSAAGTYCDDTCISTCFQIQCTCTNGGPFNGTCDIHATCDYEVTCAGETNCRSNCE